MSTHEIVDGKHGPDIICRATQDADCHQRCRNSTCESWGGDACACGPLIEVATCLAVDWIEGFGIEDCGPDGIFDEDGDMAFRGPVDVEYDDGYGYRWRPAVVAAPNNEETGRG